MSQFAWLGICHIRQDDAEHQVHAAIWTDSREGFEATLQIHLTTQNQKLIWSEEILPATRWMQKHPSEIDTLELARVVHAGHLVEMGALATAASEGYLRIDEITGIEPLDLQFGVAQKKTVPNALYGPLFGEPDGVPLKLYAILDAAKVVNLPELLVTSGLQYRCLFKGDAFEELKNVAPYVVELEEGNAFTRGLFTRSRMGGDLWDNEAGIYVRSAGSLDDMWRHFRKFTRVQDEEGKWFYFRFWEGQVFVEYMRLAQQHRTNDVPQIFVARSKDLRESLICRFICIAKIGTHMLHLSDPSEEPLINVHKVDMTLLRFIVLTAQARRFVTIFQRDEKIVPTDRSLQNDEDIAIETTIKYFKLGFKSRYHLGSFVFWALVVGREFSENNQTIQTALENTLEGTDKRFITISREVKRMFGNKIRNYHG